MGRATANANLQVLNADAVGGEFMLASLEVWRSSCPLWGVGSTGASSSSSALLLIKDFLIVQ
ncbi:hypothetical protein AcV5_002928 [Taiwanofungus camphoratus]|nr:hypothetical protein AcV5_002887 [Antrodia cinnamomea]KAI0918160.1 hypothetical protein AcV5_002928 [Antrodia cinnamomea]